MPRMKVLSRAESRTALADMVDLRFTVGAICMMTNKTPPAVYTKLKKMGRMKNGEVVRKAPPLSLSPEVLAYARRLFSEPNLVLGQMQSVAAAIQHGRNGKAV